MKLLVVDDDRALRYALDAVLSHAGFEVVAAASGEEALERLGKENVFAVVTDLAMPKMDGLTLMKKIQRLDPSLPVVLITAHGDERIAVSAMQEGAYDYLPKPFDNAHLVAIVRRAFETQSLRQDNRHLSAERVLGKRLIAKSGAMKKLLSNAAQIGRREVTALIRGETGVGKELVAAYVHANSPRVDKALVRFNCAAIASDLAEAELFGHKKGAFTGAHATRQGFFAKAHGGTLVLDEVGELSLPVQAKLLRALQEGEIQPVGLSSTEKVDVRVIASTNRDLLQEAKEGRFREDLYYRLAVVELVVPPLRERTQDIAPLAMEFLRRYRDKFDLPDLRFGDGVLEAMEAHDWPGNVRELDNSIARLAALSRDNLIAQRDLRSLWGHAEDATGTVIPIGLESSPIEVEGENEEDLSLKERVAKFEKELIQSMLQETEFNQSEAARRLRVSRVTLIDKMKRHGLK